MNISRRQMLSVSAGAIGLGLSAPLLARPYHYPSLIRAPNNKSPKQLAHDEIFWQQVASRFQTDPSFINT